MGLLLFPLYRQFVFAHLEDAFDVDAAEARLDDGLGELAVIPIEIEILQVDFSPQYDSCAGHELVVHEADAAFEFETYELVVMAYAYVVERKGERP